jgi:copper chaperone CopZ
MSDTVVYRVEGMSCEHCVAAVTLALQAVPGVDTVAVDLEAKLVTVSGDGFGDRHVRAAIGEAGYEAM